VEDIAEALLGLLDYLKPTSDGAPLAGDRGGA
jgi:hypothetical protein